MDRETHRGTQRHQGALIWASAFEQPPDCPVAFCPAVASGQQELERLNRVEAQLREALAREEVLVDQKDELIRQKDLMSKEADHRLMNSLQMVASLLSMQSRETDNPEVAEQMQIAAARITTIGSVHRRLHALDRLGSVELRQYLQNLCKDMKGILPDTDASHDLAVEGIELEVPTAIGIPLGYIVSELVTNSAKHAGGRITVTLGASPGTGYELSVSDDGPGLPDGFNPNTSKGLGMKIVSSLVRQINGQFSFGGNPAGRGARFTVQFPIGKPAAIERSTLTASAGLSAAQRQEAAA